MRASALQFRIVRARRHGPARRRRDRSRKPRVVQTAHVPLRDAHNDLCRGLMRMWLRRRRPRNHRRGAPRGPKVYAMYNAGGALKRRARRRVASTNASLFAYLADGKNGLKVLHSPRRHSQPRFYGFSPSSSRADRLLSDLEPRAGLPRAWTGTAPWTRPANQMAVFGRIGFASVQSQGDAEAISRSHGKPWPSTDGIERDQFRRGA